MVEFVKLNVGGHHYHVSRILLEKYPQSTIVRNIMAAEEGKVDVGPDAEIFIDGDGVAFRFVLNYLRHGRVFLPITESKEHFMNEVSHYDIKANPDEVYTVGHGQGHGQGQGVVQGGPAQPKRTPCKCSGPCAESCECKVSRQPCMEGCACECSDLSSGHFKHGCGKGEKVCCGCACACDVQHDYPRHCGFRFPHAYPCPDPYSCHHHGCGFHGRYY